MAPRRERNGRANAPIEVGGSSDGEREGLVSEEEKLEEDVTVVEPAPKGEQVRALPSETSVDWHIQYWKKPPAQSATSWFRSRP